MLSSFVPLFAMTFFICLFIVLMQFLWKYIDDLVGKGLDVSVIGELFFYAALSLVPMALPLAILLASLMTFGNLGERFELTAMKASGVSLVRAMKPLTFLMVFIAIGAFFFQNNVLPVAQTKMWTLLFSVKQKSPELEIPEGVFYDQIPGYNIFVESKNRENGTLYNLMIYDLSKGFDNAAVILADSGTMAMTQNKKYLVLDLFQGESFDNLREAATASANVPYRRESFNHKKIYLFFDANFNRMEEDGMRNQYVGKNIAELRHTIDSVNLRVDSVGRGYATLVSGKRYVNVDAYNSVFDTASKTYVKTLNVIEMSKPLNVDSIFKGQSSAYARQYLDKALSNLNRTKQDYEFKGLTLADDRKTIIRHGIEMHKKFTLSIACLVFFFIGAPLGAIIRKGGLGAPLVISVFLFIVYYIIDNTGNKMARDARLEVWQGMWLSTAILLPLGIFVTYKAVNDSAVFNKDAYMNFFRKLLGRNQVRHVEMKEVIMDEVDTTEAVGQINEVDKVAKHFLKAFPANPNYITYWLKGCPVSELHFLSEKVENLVGYMSNSDDKLVINKLMDIPVLKNLWAYRPAPKKWMGWTAIVLFPIGLIGYLIGRNAVKHLRRDVDNIIKVDQQLLTLITNNSNDEQ
ncbi:MAG: LptF/LptG family permease [Paramuribaculum sp.]|nr:LptF/LptG family permease [Paramuribaculum sp.]